MNYEQFLTQKRHSKSNYGIEPTFLPESLFPYQHYVADYLIRKGRCACYLDTGLGKTLIELVVAQNYTAFTGKPVLILTPLAVAFQFLKEAKKFGIDDITYSKDGKLESSLVVCNYERLSHFTPSDFDCVILDESSILKNYDGAIKNQITSFIKQVKYRFLFTATPSPNDFIELGTSSEALGYLGYTDMLTRFFKNNEDTISPMSIGTEWRLKRHAETSFFDWVSTWSISMRKPSDLGFDDSNYRLPNLITNYHPIKNEKNLVVKGQFQLFNTVAVSMQEIKSEGGLTLHERCGRAVELAEDHDTSVYWCNLNAEADLLEKLDRTAYQIKGAMSIEEKENLLLAFADGIINKLITKPSITSFGLNWQHCNHTVYFPTFSYEQYYQAIRRFWRFGQTKDVTVDLVYSDGQKRLIDSLNAKAKKASDLFSKLNSSINATYNVTTKEFDKPVVLPSFLQ